MEKLANNIVKAMVDRKVESANKELKEITKSGFPFDFADVEMSYACNEAGIKVKSGKDIVAVHKWPKRFDAEAEKAAVKEVGHEINETVRLTREAIEWRKDLDNEARDLEEDSKALEDAEKALRDANIPEDTIARMIERPADGSDEVYEAAEKAVKKANIGLPMLTIGTGRRYSEARMRIKRNRCGFVIKAGGKPILVTRWPKDGGRVEGMADYVVSLVEGCAASRRAYFAKQAALARESDRLADMSSAIESALKVAAL